MRRPNPNATPLRHCVISPMRCQQLQLQLPLHSRLFSHHANLTSKLPSRFHIHRHLPLINTKTNTKTPIRPLTTTKTMSSDNDYMAFLNKANADLDAGRSQPQHQPQSRSTTVQTGTVDVNAQIPRPLAAIDSYYVSETDEPFEPVVLKWEDAKRGVWPGFAQLSTLISPSTDLSESISTLSTEAFDPKNQYASVLRAVREAVAQGSDEGAVELRVYRVEVGSSTVEYFVLGLEATEGWVVGARARAVET